MNTLAGKTAIITGSSRGIGKEIALSLAKLGVNIVITGKTVEPHPRLEGTIYTAETEIKAVGAKALALPLDVRDESAIEEMVKKTVERFGGIDLLINNASAINISSTLQTPMKKFDLMMSVNVRATFACSQACLPFLMKSQNPHILNLSPPLNMEPRWFKDYLAYTMSKYGMSMCTLGMSKEFQGRVAVNSLWPKTAIATAAIKNNFPEHFYQASRKPEIVAQAAALILQEDKSVTGHFFIDEDYLRSKGIKDFTEYAIDPSVSLQADFFLNDFSEMRNFN